jgi:hypothetical protein
MRVALPRSNDCAIQVSLSYLFSALALLWF